MRDSVSDEDRQAAFERSVVIPETRRLYGLALVIVVDRHEAADAVQETLLSAWRHWGSLRDPGAQSAWLTRICVRRCLRHRQLLSRRVLWSSAQWEAAPAPPAIELDGRLLDVYGALSALSPPQRAMVALHIHRGLTVDECAAILGCRPGTARSHLGRAVAKLRKELTDA
ncbi:MAG: sigma-70 family RNA polymerase sigma factor [Candidatus Dormibacteria bacterium]